jgi:3-isopropylmalate/(R)-2-methylmalate dehydratase small subunit
VSSRIEQVAGRAIVLDGNDLDTDRIMPARFLKAISFDGLEAHLFEDDRRALKKQGTRHPFDDPDRTGARILLAGSNFGCGSSREHAPQALSRWGLGAIIAESFAEIFAGNSLMIGLVCMSASSADLTRLREAATSDSAREFVLDMTTARVTSGDLSVSVRMADTARAALLSGAWDTTGMLLDDVAAIERTSAQLPYIRGF